MECEESNSVYCVHRWCTLFDVVVYQWSSKEKPFCNWWHIPNAFVSTCEVPFVQHIDRIKQVCLILKVYCQLPVCVA